MQGASRGERGTMCGNDDAAAGGRAGQYHAQGRAASGAHVPGALDGKPVPQRPMGGYASACSAHEATL